MLGSELIQDGLIGCRDKSAVRAHAIGKSQNRYKSIFCYVSAVRRSMFRAARWNAGVRSDSFRGTEHDRRTLKAEP